jgi:hypothetical protein
VSSSESDLERLKDFTVVAPSTIKSASWQKAMLLAHQLTSGQRTAAAGTKLPSGDVGVVSAIGSIAEVAVRGRDGGF